MKKKPAVRSQKVGRAVPARRAAALEQEHLLAAIWRTEAAFTVASRTLKDLRAKHHRQCAELARHIRRSTLNFHPDCRVGAQPSTGAH